MWRWLLIIFALIFAGGCAGTAVTLRITGELTVLIAEEPPAAPPASPEGSR